MKKNRLLSLVLTAMFMFTGIVNGCPTVYGAADEMISGYVPFWRESIMNNSDWTYAKNSTSHNITYTRSNDATKGTLTFSKVGTSDYTGYESSHDSVKVTKAELKESEYSAVATAAYGDTIVKQTVNGSFALMRLAFMDNAAEWKTGDKIRFSMRVYPTDIYTKYNEKDTNGTVTSLTARLLYSVADATASSKPTEATVSSNIMLTPNKWNTVSAVLTLTDETAAAINNKDLGMRFDWGSKASITNLDAWTNPFASTIFYDDLFVIEKMGNCASNFMNWSLYPSDSTGMLEIRKNTSRSNGWFYFTTSGNLTTVDGYAEEKVRQDVVKTTKLAEDYPSVAEGTNSSELLKYTQNGNMFMTRLSNAVASGTYKEGDVVEASIRVFLADIYQTAQPAGGELTADTTTETLTGRILLYDQTADNKGTDKAAKTVEIPVNSWVDVKQRFEITSDLADVRGFRFDMDGSTNGSNFNKPFAGTIFFDGEWSLKKIDFTMASCFQDNMLLQRRAENKIWGDCPQSATSVSVNFNGNVIPAEISNGKWKATLPATEATEVNGEGHTITVSVSTNDGIERDDISLSNVAFGELVLAAGQSNIAAVTVEDVTSGGIDTVIDDTNNVDIRLLTVTKTSTGAGSFEEKASLINPNWVKVKKENVGNATAVGYITAYKLAKAESVPVGVIETALSGTRIQTFLSEETLKSRTEYAELVNTMNTDKANGTFSDTERAWKAYPSGLYNSMLAPLNGLSIGACVWYQGCANVGNNKNIYSLMLEDLVNQLRDEFGDNMAICVCQLAPYSADEYSFIRQVQLDISKKMEGVYLVATADAGPKNDDYFTTGVIHPTDKLPVGERAALAIRHHLGTYVGEYSGPVCESAERNGNKLVLNFSHADGLNAKDLNGTTELTGFEISADGVNFIEASAVISGTTVELSAAGVTMPKYVRYCQWGWTYFDADGNLSHEEKNDFALLRNYVNKNNETVTAESEVDLKAAYANGDIKSFTYNISGNMGGNLYNSANLPCAPFALTADDVMTTDETVIVTENGVALEFVTNNPNNISAWVVAAVYDNNGVLKDCRTANLGTGTKTERFEFAASGTEVKLFLFDSPAVIKPLQIVKRFGIN